MKNKVLLFSTAFLLLAAAVVAFNVNANPTVGANESKAASVTQPATDQAAPTECTTKCAASESKSCCAAGAQSVCTPEEAAAAGCVPCPPSPGCEPCCTVDGVPHCKK